MTNERKMTPIPTPTAADIADAVMVARQNAERANDVRLRCAWTALEALILGGPDTPCEGILSTATLGDIAYWMEFGYIRTMKQIDADTALEAVWGAGLVRDDAGRQHWLKIAEADEAKRSEAEHKNDYAAMVAAVLAARPPEGTDRGKTMKHTYELGLTDRQTGNKLVLRVQAENGAEAVAGVAGVLIPADGADYDGGETCYKLRYCREHASRLARALAGEPQRIP